MESGLIKPPQKLDVVKLKRVGHDEDRMHLDSLAEFFDKSGSVDGRVISEDHWYFRLATRLQHL